MQKIIEYIENKSDAILTYSSLGETYFRNIGVPRERIFKAINVVDTEKREREIAAIRDKVSKNDNVFHVLFVGALTLEKRLNVLLEAFAKLEKRYEAVFLTIVGEGAARVVLQAQADALRIRNINFAGKQTGGVSRYFLAADLFVLPGLGGLAISDAMIHGLPVIVSIADGTELDLVDDQVGITDQDLDADKLFSYMEWGYNHRELLQEKGKNAYDKIKHNFSFNHYVDVLTKCIAFVNKKGGSV